MADQNSQYYAILTNVGAAKQANADALGVAWQITHMAVGDANGTEPLPSATQTRLIREVRRAPLNSLDLDPKNPSVIVAEQILPADVGGFWIRELGLYDSDNNLVAVANCPPSFKPLLAQGSGRTQTVRINLIVSSAASVELKIDPTVVMASRAYVDQAVTAEINKLDHKKSVRVATTANLTLSGLQTVDSIVMYAGQRVLVKNQTDSSQNGIYVVASGNWPRATDADGNPEVTPQLEVGVEEGAENGDTFWFLSNNGTITVGTTGLTFQQLVTVRMLNGMGLGITDNAPVIENLDAVTTPSGFYRSIQSGTIGTFPPNASLYAHVLVERNGSTTLKQTYTPVGNGNGAGSIWTRVYNPVSGVWLDWQCLATVDSPSFTGTPAAPTPAPGNNSGQLATTAFVRAALSAVGIGIAGSAPLIADLDTTTTESGFYRSTLAATVGTFPPGMSTYAHVLIERNDASTIKQTYTPVGNVAGAGTVWTRVYNSVGNAWLAWQCSANLNSPSFTGTPAAPTATPGTNTTQLATTAFVQAAVSALVNAAPGALDTLKELATALGNDANFSTTIMGLLGQKAPLLSPALSGTPTAPTAPGGTSSTQLATTAFVRAALSAVGIGISGSAPLIADLDTTTTDSGFYRSTLAATVGTFPPGMSPYAHVLIERNDASTIKQTYTPVGNVAGAGTVWTRVYNSVGNAWLDWQCSANLNSPSFIGTPAAPTATPGTNTTQLATTAFVQAAVSALVASAPGTLDTLKELATALGNDANFSATIMGLLGQKAPLVSPALSGTPTAPTAPGGTSSTQLATTAFVRAALSAVGIGIAGSAPVLGDLDTTTTESGFYRSTLSGTLGTFPPGMSTYAHVLIERNDASTIKQTYTPVGNVAGAGTVWMRVYNTVGNAWLDWQCSANLNSPAFTGTPTAPTATAGTSTTQLANTAFVQAAVSALVNGAPGTLDTLKKLATALGNDANFAATITALVGQRAPLVSPALSGTPTAPTAAAGVNTTQLATTAFVQAAIAGLVNSAPGALDTLKEFADALGNDANFSTTIMNQLSQKAPLASPALTGAPTAPTPSAGNSSTQLATTAFVKGALNATGLGITGSAPLIANLDSTTTESGFYRSSLSGTVGTFPPNMSTYAYVLVERNDASALKQTFTPVGNVTGAGTEWTRVYNAVSGLWLEWQCSATLSQLAAQFTERDAGMVFFTAGSAAPRGALKANGAVVSRTTYAALFAAIGTRYGAGDGSTTFSLPDLRGEFVRGWSDGTTVDSGRALGSSQLGQNEEHNHSGTTSVTGEHRHTTNVKRDLGRGHTADDRDAFYGDEPQDTPINQEDLLSSKAGDHSHTLLINSQGGSEARPRNIALLACIRF
ncbi:phage tail protein [Pseudomonas syringae]|nr:phage tail protein [Pseudomonas syringae]MBD8802303.1 phage tail protein [Pseudomonas syringae]MBD8812872.1 phage tail protein [Pseudomonas syringae]